MKLIGHESQIIGRHAFQGAVVVQALEGKLARSKSRHLDVVTRSEPCLLVG